LTHSKGKQVHVRTCEELLTQTVVCIDVTVMIVMLNDEN